MITNDKTKRRYKKAVYQCEKDKEGLEVCKNRSHLPTRRLQKLKADAMV